MKIAGVSTVQGQSAGGGSLDLKLEDQGSKDLLKCARMVFLSNCHYVMSSSSDRLQNHQPSSMCGVVSAQRGEMLSTLKKCKYVTVYAGCKVKQNDVIMNVVGVLISVADVCLLLN